MAPDPGTSPLPAFRYHPDPVASGSVEASAAACLACGRERGYIYVGPVYSEEEYDEAFCPWCIADGTAATRFDATFTDVGWGIPDDVATPVLIEISERTPGFMSWQQDHWLYHCGDGCAFIGLVGRRELGRYPDAREMLLHEHDEYGWSEADSAEYVDGLSTEGDATAYLFRCLVCGTHVAFSDTA